MNCVALAERKLARVGPTTRIEIGQIDSDTVCVVAMSAEDGTQDCSFSDNHEAGTDVLPLLTEAVARQEEMQGMIVSLTKVLHEMRASGGAPDAVPADSCSSCARCAALEQKLADTEARLAAVLDDRAALLHEMALLRVTADAVEDKLQHIQGEMAQLSLLEDRRSHAGNSSSMPSRAAGPAPQWRAAMPQHSHPQPQQQPPQQHSAIVRSADVSAYASGYASSNASVLSVSAGQADAAVHAPSAAGYDSGARPAAAAASAASSRAGSLSSISAGPSLHDAGSIGSMQRPLLLRRGGGPG